MATLTLYNFAKRKNSTASPTGAGTDFSVVLKEQTDLIRPVFKLAYSGVPSWSYASFGGRYYFVTGYESITNDIWAVKCAVDVLATYKSQILASSAFVLYDTTANSEICDHRLSTKTSKTVSSASASFAGLSTTPSDCKAIVSIVGKSSTASWLIPTSVAEELTDRIENWVNNIVDPDDWTDDPAGAICEVGRQLLSTGNANECIRSAILVPWAGSITLSPGTIYLGDFSTGINTSGDGVGIITDAHRIVKDIVNVTIPWQHTDWRRNSPYTEVYVYIPYIGYLHLPTSNLIGESSLSLEASLDIKSGACIFRLYTSSGTIGQYETNLSISFPIGSSNVNPLQMLSGGLSSISSAVGFVGSVMAGNYAAAGQQGFSAIQGALNGMTPMPSCIGGNSSGAVLGLENKVYCYCVVHDTTVLPDSVSAIMGTPAMAVKSLSALTGYVQTVGASVSGAMTDDERMMINQYLDGGVYIE